MANKKREQMELKEVIPTLEQIDDLYIQLQNRSYSISHKLLPSYDQHKKFVFSNPYRGWFIIKNVSGSIGNVYVQFDNSIGLNCKDDIATEQIKDILTMIITRLAPLEASASIRYGGYFLNVSAENIVLQEKLKEAGLVEAQRTYVVNEVSLKN